MHAAHRAFTVAVWILLVVSVVLVATALIGLAAAGALAIVYLLSLLEQ